MSPSSSSLLPSLCPPRDSTPTQVLLDILPASVSLWATAPLLWPERG